MNRSDFYLLTAFIYLAPHAELTFATIFAFVMLLIGAISAYHEIKESK